MQVKCKENKKENKWISKSVKFVMGGKKKTYEGNMEKKVKL